MSATIDGLQKALNQQAEDKLDKLLAEAFQELERFRESHGYPGEWIGLDTTDLSRRASITQHRDTSGLVLVKAWAFIASFKKAMRESMVDKFREREVSEFLNQVSQGKE